MHFQTHVVKNSFPVGGIYIPHPVHHRARSRRLRDSHQAWSFSPAGRLFDADTRRARFRDRVSRHLDLSTPHLAQLLGQTVQLGLQSRHLGRLGCLMAEGSMFRARTRASSDQIWHDHTGARKAPLLALVARISAVALAPEKHARLSDAVQGCWGRSWANSLLLATYGARVPDTAALLGTLVIGRVSARRLGSHWRVSVNWILSTSELGVVDSFLYGLRLRKQDSASNVSKKRMDWA